MNQEGLVRKVKVKLGSRNLRKGSDAKCAVVERPLSTESCSLFGRRALKEDLTSWLESFSVLREIIHDLLSPFKNY